MPHELFREFAAEGGPFPFEDIEDVRVLSGVDENSGMSYMPLQVRKSTMA